MYQYSYTENLGCGKSERVKQLDPDFIELNLSHLDPELLDGLAGEKDGKAVHIKPPWLEELEAKCQEEADKIHIFIFRRINKCITNDAIKGLWNCIR